MAALPARHSLGALPRDAGFHAAGRRLAVSRRAPCTMMAKKGIHPEFFPEAKVLLNGEEVVRMGGTKQEYNVDIWSGNHPYYQGTSGAVVIDEDQVNRFMRRFGTIGAYGKVAVLTKQLPDPVKVGGKPKTKGKK